MSDRTTTIISCQDCTAQLTDRCSDCLVSFICGREPDDAVIIDVAEARAVRMLARAGLIGDLKFESRIG